MLGRLLEMLKSSYGTPDASYAAMYDAQNQVHELDMLAHGASLARGRTGAKQLPNKCVALCMSMLPTIGGIDTEVSRAESN